MKKFWQWMIDNNHGYRDDPYSDGTPVYKVYGAAHGFGKRPTKQMLIGYMIEFLLLKDNDHILPLIEIGNCENIEDVNNLLTKKIKELDNGNKQ